LIVLHAALKIEIDSVACSVEIEKVYKGLKTC